ncbi:MAG: hypothetical protein K6G30_00660 [Acetatifactor sp.]|nr:hypothetical protein [Acetatifactor sp.]
MEVVGLDGILRDISVVRMNVDNYEEAYEILISHGFRNTRGEDIIQEKSAKSAMMVAPSGFQIMLIQHLKK